MATEYWQDDSLSAQLIRDANFPELMRRRLVRGRDLHDWHEHLAFWKIIGETREALTLLGEIITAVETLPQYDPREPQHYWYIEASKLHEAHGDPQAAIRVLERWESHWPEAEREAVPSHRKQVESRLRRLRRAQAKDAG